MSLCDDSPASASINHPRVLVNVVVGFVVPVVARVAVVCYSSNTQSTHGGLDNDNNETSLSSPHDNDDKSDALNDDG